MSMAGKGGVVLVAALVAAGSGWACGQTPASTLNPGAAKTAPAKAAPKASVPVKFLLEYQGQGDADVRNDPQFMTLLKRTLPQPKFFGYGLTLMKAIPYYIGVGSGRVTVDDGRYAVVTGCVPHMCDTSEGLLWVDTGSAPPEVLFAAIGPVDDTQPASTATYELWIYGSKTLDADANHAAPLPADFMKQLDDFAGGRAIASATFVEPNSKQISLSPAQSLHLASSQPDSSRAVSSKGTQ